LTLSEAFHVGPTACPPILLPSCSTVLRNVTAKNKKDCSNFRTRGIVASLSTSDPVKFVGGFATPVNTSQKMKSIIFFFFSRQQASKPNISSSSREERTQINRAVEWFTVAREVGYTHVCDNCHEQ
jgi:hypothetical protein